MEIPNMADQHRSLSEWAEQTDHSLASLEADEYDDREAEEIIPGVRVGDVERLSRGEDPAGMLTTDGMPPRRPVDPYTGWTDAEALDKLAGFLKGQQAFDDLALRRFVAEALERTGRGQ
jgi:hypothetical protein